MTNEQKELIWKTIGMLWTIASIQGETFAEIAADFAEDLSIAFDAGGDKQCQ